MSLWKVYFIQIKGSTEISIGINSDREDNGKSIYNKWLGKDLCIEEEVLDDGKIGYSVVASEKDAYYRIVGKISEEELKKIIEKLSY